jgi:regulator of Ty1 transposition protein 103
VVEVWRQRQIFEMPIQDAIEARIEGMRCSLQLYMKAKTWTELDRNRGGKGGMGTSLFSKGGSSVPTELAAAATSLQAVSKLNLSTRTSLNAANQDYDKITDPNAVTPSAPVHAARLNGLLKTLANAEGAVSESIKARNVLIKELEQILKSQYDQLAEEETQLRRLSSRRTEIDAKKKDVEDTIMRGFASNSNPSTPAADGTPKQAHSPTTPGQEPDRPEIEALTPPNQSPKSPLREPDHSQFGSGLKATYASRSPPQAQSISPPPPVATAGSDLLASLSGHNNYVSSNSNGNSAKKRKLNTAADDFPDLGGDAMDDIDDDVAAMLRQ